jgi:hypothetical protein
VDSVDDIFADNAISKKWRPNPTGRPTNRLPVVWKIAMNRPSGGSVRISAKAVLIHADFTMKSGVKLFRGLLTYVSFVRL